MPLHRFVQITAGALIVISAWAYFASGMASFTALIPGGFGLALGMCGAAMAGSRRWAGYLAALLSALLIAVLSVPLKGAIGREDAMAVFRILIMMIGAGATLAAILYSLVAGAGRRT